MRKISSISHFFCVAFVLLHICVVNQWLDRSWIGKIDMGEVENFSQPLLPHSVAVVTLYIHRMYGLSESTVEHVIQQWGEYCAKHKYDFFLVREKLCSTRSAAWQKIPQVLRLLFPLNGKKYTWVWLLDLDALITNPSLSMEHHVLECAKKLKPTLHILNVTAIATRDCNWINFGSMLFQRTGETRKLLIDA